jgi:hypothetical protein
MGKVYQHLNALQDDVVRALAANAGDETNAAGVMLVAGIVKPLGCGKTLPRLPSWIVHKVETLSPVVWNTITGS